MLTASHDFQQALTQSHIAVVRLTLLRRDIDGARTAVGQIPVTDGTYTVDGQADTWRSLTASIPNEYVSEAGDTVANLINAYDCDLRVEFGVQLDWDWDLGGPSQEFVQVARLRVDKAKIGRLGASVDVEATDDGARLADYPIIRPWPGEYYDENGDLLYADDDFDRNVVDTIKYFVNDCYPSSGHPDWTVHDDVDLIQRWPIDSKFQGDRWEQVRKLAEAIGCWVHNDELGHWVIAPLPTEGTPVLTLDEGDLGTLTRSEVESSRVDTYNGVGVRYELPSTGSGLAFEYDSNPFSPTYWDGPFGKRSIIVDNDTVDNDTDAIAAAVKLLNQYKGRGQQINCKAVWNPLLEPGDTINVRTPTGALETHLVDRIDLPIPLGEMTLTTRVVEVT